MQNNELSINCSPGTFRKCESDSNYRQQVIQQVAGESSYETIVFYENAATESDIASQEILPTVSGSSDQDFVPIGSCESPEGKNVWLDAPIKFLISKVRDLRPKVGKSATLKNKKQMWISISNELCEKGYMFTALQVEAKFYSLERQYKRVKLHNSKTGRSRLSCPYQVELDEIFKEKTSVFPEAVLDGDITTEISDADEDIDSAPATPETPSSSSNARKRKSVMEQYIDEKRKSDAQLYKMLEENMRKKEERAEQKVQIEREKLEILKSLTESLRKTKN